MKSSCECVQYFKGSCVFLRVRICTANKFINYLMLNTPTSEITQRNYGMSHLHYSSFSSVTNVQFNTVDSIITMYNMLVTKYLSVLFNWFLFYFTVIELIDFPHVVTSEDTEEKIHIYIREMYREFVSFTSGSLRWCWW